VIRLNAASTWSAVGRPALAIDSAMLASSGSPAASSGSNLEDEGDAVVLVELREHRRLGDAEAARRQHPRHAGVRLLVALARADEDGVGWRRSSASHAPSISLCSTPGGESWS